MRSLKLAKSSTLVLGGILTTGAAYYFGTGLNGFAPLVWIAPIPFLLLALNSTARRTATAAASNPVGLAAR